MCDLKHSFALLDALRSGSSFSRSRLDRQGEIVPSSDPLRICEGLLNYTGVTRKGGSRSPEVDLLGDTAIGVEVAVESELYEHASSAALRVCIVAGRWSDVRHYVCLPWR